MALFQPTPQKKKNAAPPSEGWRRAPTPLPGQVREGLKGAKTFIYATGLVGVSPLQFPWRLLESLDFTAKS